MTEVKSPEDPQVPTPPTAEDPPGGSSEGEPVEVLAVQPQHLKSDVQLWTDLVWEQHRNQCANCGGSDRLRLKMVVPIEAGGQYVVSNGVILCRTCEIAADSTRPAGNDSRRPINFWVSQSLYQSLKDHAKDSAFHSMASLVRYLMSKYVANVTGFDDLEKYQAAAEVGSDVKINVWVERDMYAAFKDLVVERGLTVTDALKALILMYAAASEGQKKRTDS